MTVPQRPPEPAAQVVNGDRTADGGSPGAPEAAEAAEAAGTQAGTPAGTDAEPQSPAAPEEPLPVEGDGYRVTLDRFEGPLDLLLYLIRKEKVDIYDIPISRITDQFLESIGELERLDVDLDRAGEFLVMAATLMRIKSRMLVPRDDADEDGEDEIDPREELVRRLLEYREFKRVSETLREREDEWREVFARAGSLRLPDPDPAGFEDLGVSMVDLFKAFQKILDAADKEPDTPFRMNSEEYDVDERMDYIRGECDDMGKAGVSFSKLFGGARRTRPLLIATFLGLLELIRLREVAVGQVDRFGEIWIRHREEAPTS